MGYRSLADVVVDLEESGQLIRIREEVDPNLEMAAIHRRVYQQGGPALFFERVKESPFPALSNIYGTVQRTEYLFRHTIEQVRKVVDLKADPMQLLRNPAKYWKAPFTALKGLPKKVSRHRLLSTSIDKLPQVVSWPLDGGAFITLPQVLTEAPGSRSIMQSNLGMYRIQLSGNEYTTNQEVGMHYQIHRGIGVHHEAYKRSALPFQCSVFVGGLPSHALAAIFPLPEGLSELTFAGMLGGRRFRYVREGDHVISVDADFVLTGTILKDVQKPEGPFGDHLGYYSLQHDFPVMKIDRVLHRKNAIWHFTVVGRPPQEDTSFGYMIHRIVEPLLPQEFPGIKEVNAVDEAGVHPLLLAIGSERYMPFRERQPEEILTQANHLLGKGQTSLAKYLIIAEDDREADLTTHKIDHFLRHVLARIDWRRDLHFQTKTTIDTLDYSGHGWNAGSKVVMACSGAPLRKLGTNVPCGINWPSMVVDCQVAIPGVLLLQVLDSFQATAAIISALQHSVPSSLVDAFPLLVLVDDAAFVSQSLANFLWVTFTRSNPATDIDGIDAFYEHKHWGCHGPLVIDATIKEHHAPPLIEDEGVNRRVDRFFKTGGVLADWG